MKYAEIIILKETFLKSLKKKMVASSCGVQIIIQLSFSYELKTHPVCKQSGFFFISVESWLLNREDIHNPLFLDC